MAASILLVGCDIDFVEVDEIGYGRVSLLSEHEKALEASVEIVLPIEGTPSLVRLAGVELRGEREGDRWRAETKLSVDSLAPQLELVIQGSDPVALVLPLVTRNGAAVWLQNGDLELPVVYRGDPSAPELTWQATLVDSSGALMVGITSRGAPLPIPLVFRRELVPAGAVAAMLIVNFGREIADAAYPLNVGISGSVRFPIPSYPDNN
jgi:hypothetical protein